MSAIQPINEDPIMHFSVSVLPHRQDLQVAARNVYLPASSQISTGGPHSLVI